MPRLKIKPIRKWESARYDGQWQPAAPVWPEQIDVFDPDREMRQKPHPEGSQWRK